MNLSIVYEIMQLLNKGDIVAMKITDSKGPYENEPQDKDIWSLYKPSNGFNLTQNELDQIFSAVKSKVKEEKENDCSSDQTITITDENGLTLFGFLPSFE